jgi:transitional endoplasmic reticulum ATPase
MDFADGMPYLIVGGEVKQKHKAEIAQLCTLTRKLLKERSVYRGQAVRVKFPDNDELSATDAPKFLDLTNVKDDELIFPWETMELVKSSLFTPIRHTQACRDVRVPLKRGVLLEGPFGVGKTLTAYVTAKYCV